MKRALIALVDSGALILLIGGILVAVVFVALAA